MKENIFFSMILSPIFSTSLFSVSQDKEEIAHSFLLATIETVVILQNRILYSRMFPFPPNKNIPDLLPIFLGLS